MATRLATTRNFITVTAVPQNDNNEDDMKSTSLESQNDNSLTDVQCTTQITPIALHHVNLSQVQLSKFDENVDKIYIKNFTNRKKLFSILERMGV